MNFYLLEPKNKANWNWDGIYTKIIIAKSVPEARQIAGKEWLKSKTVKCTKLDPQKFQQGKLLCESHEFDY
jgi:hypothetical protein